LRILFDQGVPVPLRKGLPTHEVATAFELGWSTLRNGELLSAAERDQFNLLVTTDQNLKYQQNMANRLISVIVLLSTSWPRIQKCIADIGAAVDRAKPGSYEEVVVP